MKTEEIKPIYCDFIPEKILPGYIYISKKYEIAIHLCACGCGIKTATPISSGEWILTDINDSITLRPSIGNFMGELQYHAHYYITNGKIEWL